MTPRAFAELGSERIAEIESEHYGKTVHACEFADALFQPEFQ